MAEAPTLTDAFAQVADQLEAFNALVAGERKKLEGLGFSPTVAEQMAAHLYTALVTRAFSMPPEAR